MTYAPAIVHGGLSSIQAAEAITIARLPSNGVRDNF
jgi:hypothetical protein